MKTGDIQSLKGWQMRVPRLLRGMWGGKGGREDSLSGNWKLLKGTIGNGVTIENCCTVSDSVNRNYGVSKTFRDSPRCQSQTASNGKDILTPDLQVIQSIM
jgi:hypothetical protein